MTFTAEQLEIRALARDFAQTEIAPHAEAWDAAGKIPDDLFLRMAELGFLGMLVPERYGGLDLDVATYLLVLEEIARADASVALTVAIHSGPVPGILLAHGSESQKEGWLPRLASGEIIGAFALTEPGAGSDAAAIACVARRAGAGWALDGEKSWVTNGARAGLVMTFARTSPEGVGCFLAEPSQEGYHIVRSVTTMGHRASETVDVALRGLEVGDESLIGDPQRAFTYALEGLVLGRAGIAAQALGIAQASLDHATRYSLEREQFGRPLSDFGATQAKLANMAARISAVRSTIQEVGRRLDRERRGDRDTGTGADALVARAAGAKLLASETAMYAADEAVQIFGGYGYMRDYPVERLMRDAKGTEIFEGTSEIMRVVIAREIIKAAREA
ncbi:MAG: acyl-CoA dehydrogenase family protein [Gemmatimonadales bacterium]|nr:MAG: acyl-CoA dehydrogenase family protein [Gemmatimonadales bacterium]